MIKQFLRETKAAATTITAVAAINTHWEGRTAAALGVERAHSEVMGYDGDLHRDVSESRLWQFGAATP